jgi:hypothetical protein
VQADLLVQLSLARLQRLDLGDRRVLAREELVLLLDVQRLFLRGDGEVFLETLQLRAGALALRLALAQVCSARARCAAMIRASSAARGSSSSDCSSAAMPLARDSSLPRSASRSAISLDGEDARVAPSVFRR